MMPVPSFILRVNYKSQFALNLPVEVKNQVKKALNDDIMIHTALYSFNAKVYEDMSGVLYLEQSFMFDLFEKLKLNEGCYLHCFSTIPGHLFVKPIDEKGEGICYKAEEEEEDAHFQHPSYLRVLESDNKDNLSLSTTFGYAALTKALKPSFLKTHKGCFPVITQYRGEKGLDFVGATWKDFYEDHRLHEAAYILFQYEGDAHFAVSFYSINGGQHPFHVAYPALEGIPVGNLLHLRNKQPYQGTEAVGHIGLALHGNPGPEDHGVFKKRKLNSAEGIASGSGEMSRPVTDATSFVIKMRKEKISMNRVVLPVEATFIRSLMRKNKVVLNCKGKSFNMDLHHYTEVKTGNVEVPMIQMIGNWQVICNQRPSWLRKKIQFQIHRHQPEGSEAVSMTAYILV